MKKIIGNKNARTNGSFMEMGTQKIFMQQSKSRDQEMRL